MDSGWWLAQQPTTNNPTGEPVAWVGKTPLAPLGETPRPQWLPYQGRPNTHQPTTNNQQPNGRTSYLRECYQKRSTRFTNNQLNVVHDI
ncbi:MAG: hypothetical protein ACHBN1_20145 [Heteroscytonema crispum UTEX LB 1556]